MKLNSKIPIVVIMSTISLFLVLSFRSNETDLNIKTIKGNINEIKDLNIEAEYNYNNRYLQHKYTINKNNFYKDTNLLQTRYNSMLQYRYHSNASYTVFEEKYAPSIINTLDIVSGEDDISYIGYEYSYLDDNDIEDVKFIYNKNSKNNKDMILQSQGSDKEIYPEEIKDYYETKNEININLEDTPKNLQIKALSSNRYKDEVYIMSNYYVSFSNKNIIEISKLNEKENKLEVINSIDIFKNINVFKYISEVYSSNEIAVIDSSKYRDNFYALVSMSNGNSYSNSKLGRLYLFTYNISNNTYEIEKITNKEYLNIIDSEFKDDKLNLITYGTNNSKVKSDVEVIDISYDIVSKKIVHQNEITIEKDIYNKNGRRIYDDTSGRKIERILYDSVVDGDKIYLYLVDDLSYDWSNKNRLYVVDRSSQIITYEGKIIYNPNNSFIDLKKSEI